MSKTLANVEARIKGLQDQAKEKFKQLEGSVASYRYALDPMTRASVCRVRSYAVCLLSVPCVAFGGS